MTKLVVENRTRYSSEDVSAIYESLLTRWGVIAAQLGDGHVNERLPLTIKMKYWTPDSDEFTRLLVRRWKRYATFYIASYGNVARAFPLETMAKCEDGQQLLPAPVLGEVVFSLRALLPRLAEPQGVELCQEVFQTARIRVMDRIENPSAKLTPQERITTLRNEYGSGGHLYGGSKNQSWQWEARLEKARHAYEEEWRRREAWSKKLRAAGDSPKPYLTWSEYLRYRADEWDRIHKGRG